MSISGTPFPTSEKAYHGIELWPVALKMGLLPGNVSTETIEGRLEITCSFAGDYTYYFYASCHQRDNQNEVAYYAAHNRRNQRTEFAVGADRVDDFIKDAKTFIWAAGLFYGIGREASPATVEIVIAQRHALAGRPWEAMKANMRAAGEMWKDPMTVMGAAADIGALGSVGHIKPKIPKRVPPASHYRLPKSQPNIPSNTSIVSPVYEVSGRDLVIVDTSVGRKAFYRSSGTNSGRPGTWYPVDEFRVFDGWFNKTAYVKGPNLAKGQPLHRLGNPEFARISEQLGKANLSKGHKIPAGVMENEYVSANRILDFFNVNLTDTTMFRPVPE